MTDDRISDIGIDFPDELPDFNLNEFKSILFDS